MLVRHIAPSVIMSHHLCCSFSLYISNIQNYCDYSVKFGAVCLFFLRELAAQIAKNQVFSLQNCDQYFIYKINLKQHKHFLPYTYFHTGKIFWHHHPTLFSDTTPKSYCGKHNTVKKSVPVFTWKCLILLSAVLDLE